MLRASPRSRACSALMSSQMTGTRRQPEPTRRHQALVAADDGGVLPSRHHRLHEAELAEAALEGVELLLADAPRVGGIGTEEVDGDLLDDQRGEDAGGDDHAIRSATTLARGVRLIMRNRTDR